jgi:hypothetical protein
LTKPKPLAVIRQQLDRRRPSIPEHEYRAREWVRAERLAAHADQAIDPAAEIGGLDRDQ